MSHEDKAIVLDDRNVFLSDWHYWGERMPALDAWCGDNQVTRLGMFLTFPDQQTLTSFVLQWT